MNNQPPPPELSDAAPTARKGHKGKGRSAAVKETTAKPISKRDQTPAYKPPPPGMEKAKQVGQVKPLATMSINAMKAAGMKPTNHIPKGLQDDIADYAEHEERQSAGPDVTRMFELRALDPYMANTQQNVTSFLASLTTQQQIDWIQSRGIEGSEEWVRDIAYNGAYGHVNQPPHELIEAIDDAKHAERVRQAAEGTTRLAMLS